MRSKATPSWVLFFGIVTSASVWLPFVIWSTVSPATFPSADFQTTAIGARAHGLLFSKSAIVAGSWILGYFTIMHLPSSIAASIRATSPRWTILAVLLMRESPINWQWLGITIVLAADLLCFTATHCRIHHLPRWNLAIFREKNSPYSSASHCSKPRASLSVNRENGQSP